MIEAAAWLEAHGCRLSIVTLGREGCVWSHDGVVSRLPAHPAAVVDTTGAGDTFCGVLVARLAQGQPIASVLVAAQAAAALTVGRPDAFAALPTVAELRSA